MSETPVPEDIKRDALSYFQSLGSDERNATSLYNSLEYLEDGHGRHAVILSAPHDGERWCYAVLYDPDNRRVKVLKYSIGSYSS